MLVVKNPVDYRRDLQSTAIWSLACAAIETKRKALCNQRTLAPPTLLIIGMHLHASSFNMSIKSASIYIDLEIQRAVAFLLFPRARIREAVLHWHILWISTWRASWLAFNKGHFIKRQPASHRNAKSEWYVPPQELGVRIGGTLSVKPHAKMRHGAPLLQQVALPLEVVALRRHASSGGILFDFSRVCMSECTPGLFLELLQ